MTSTSIRVGHERVIQTITQVDRFIFDRTSAGWQLPCGCIGPDIYVCEEKQESYCTDCMRGWKFMTDYCRMLDGGRQGPPVLVLTKEMIHVEKSL